MPSDDGDDKTDLHPDFVGGTDDNPVALPIEDSLDLHTFQPGEVKELLDDYLEAACAMGFREVLIIHGKGHGILRRRVRAILSAHPRVADFRDAEPHRGGWGAAVAKLVSNTSSSIGNPPEQATVIAEENTDTAAHGHRAESERSTSLHHLSGPQLLVPLVLGMSLGALLYQVLLEFGARSEPGLIVAYGLCISYGLMRKAASVLQVVRRAAWALLILTGLWLAVHSIR